MKETLTTIDQTKTMNSVETTYSSGAGGVGGRSRIVNGGGVRASGLRSRMSNG